MKNHSNKLIDSHGRVIHKLRVSLLDACNFSCMYCMPDTKNFTPKANWPSANELVDICNNLISYGIDEIRLTGGEPFLRPDVMEIISKLSKLPLEKFGITTNGFHTEKYLYELKDTNCQHLNFSLDSLNKNQFHMMTRIDGLESVLKSILMAKELGFNVKINCVLMKTCNDQEIMDFVEFSESHDIEVRFLELMRVGPIRHRFDDYFMPATEIINLIAKYRSISDKEMPIDSTSFNFTTPKGGNIGIIASESRPFCGACSRLRLGPDGTLRPCLFVNEGISLVNIPNENYPQILKHLIAQKPLERIRDNFRSMNEIGG